MFILRATEQLLRDRKVILSERNLLEIPLRAWQGHHSLDSVALNSLKSPEFSVITLINRLLFWSA